MTENPIEKRELRRMWTVVKFYCLQNKMATKTFEKMKVVYGDNYCLSWTLLFVLHKEFNEGRETAELRNREHSGQSRTLLSEINVNMVRVLVDKDRSLTCRKMVGIMDCSKSTIENILKKLSMWRVASRWVLHRLIKEQLQKRVDVCKR